MEDTISPDATYDTALEGMFRASAPVHFCSLYDSGEEQFSALVPFLITGLSKNEKCFYICDRSTEDEIIEAILSARSIDPELLERNLTFCPKEDFYLAGGSFDLHRVLKSLSEVEKQAMAEGFSRLRAAGEMSWACYDAEAMKDLAEYEARVNYLYPDFNCTAFCQYEESEFELEMLMDVIRTHPRIAMRGTLCWNPYYVPPDDFLARRRGEMPKGMYDRMWKDILKRARFAEIHMMELREFRRANRKIDMFNDLLFKEIQNQLSVMSFFSEMAVDACKDAGTRDYILEVSRKCAEVQKRLNFMKTYQMIGMLEPRWQPLAEAIDLAVRSVGVETVRISPKLARIEVLSDDLLGDAFQTILENLRRARSQGLEIEVSSLRSLDGVIVAFEGNCKGVAQEDKDRLFEREYCEGGFDGYDMFLARELLQASGMNIREVGVPGKMVRFEIMIPPNRFRPIG